MKHQTPANSAQRHLRHIGLRRAGAALIGLSLTAMGLSHAQTALPTKPTTPPPIEHFFKPSTLRLPELSPSGHKLAMIRPGKQGRMSLAVAPVSDPSKLVGVAGFEDADIRSFDWVNDDRLVFDVYDAQSTLGDQLGTGLYAVNADGSDQKWLIDRRHDGQRMSQGASAPLPTRFAYVGPIHDGTDEVYAFHYEGDRANNTYTASLIRLNTRTMGQKRAYTGDIPIGTQGWWLDPLGRTQVIMTDEGGQKSAVRWRDQGQGPWVKLVTNDPFVPQDTDFTPVGLDEQGQLYVTATGPLAKNPSGTTALYRYDLKQQRLSSEPVLSIPGFDFAGRLLWDGGKGRQLLGVSYLQEAPGVHWLHPDMVALQADLDRQLPNTNNLIRCTRCLGAAQVVVEASSDVQSPVYFLYHTQTRALQLIGASRGWLDPKSSGSPQDLHRVKMRDGLDIPVYVTKPKGPGPFPTVVLVHGGPYVRGVQWGFNPDTQFLASRGYLVVEPEFRGSTGYGSRLFRAGWKQWGLAMQDDITDATRWAIAQQGADPKRIALAGASYGGYATLMGLIKEPDLYKAGINWVGVSDIQLMYDIGWSDFLDADSPWVRYGMPRMIGDPAKDAAQLKLTSPLQQAARLHQPLLMAYGTEDKRVPLPHGEKMRDALRAAGNRQVQWVAYDGEGHGFLLTKNQVDFWGRVEAFLAQHLKAQ